MPDISSKTPADRSLANTTNVRTRINGDMELEPTNYFKNWHFNDINEDGDPDCLRIGLPEKPDGWWVYLSEAGKGPSTLAAQNDEPLPIHQVSYVSSQTWVGGKPPVTPGFAADIGAPDAPGYQLIDSTRAGFEAGVWYVAYTFGDYHNRQTEMSPTVTVTVAQGQGIRVYLPSSIPDQAFRFVVYMGRSAYSMRIATGIILSRFQPESILLPGPFVKDSSPPTTNQTAQFTPRIPGIALKSANTTLQPGTYTASGAAVDSTGTSSASQNTRTITVSDPMPNTALEITPGYEENCVFDDEDPSDFVDASIRHKIFINKDGVDYLGYDPSRGSPERTLSAQDALAISGFTQNDQPPLSTQRFLLGILERIGSAPRESNSETGEQGLASPYTPLDPPTPEGLAVLPPGTYWFAVSYTVRGKETTVSNPVQVTILSGKMLRIIFPDTANAIPDPNVFERDSGGIPFSHVLTSGVGSAAPDPDQGTIILDTLGSINTSTQTAPSHYVEFPVDRGLTYNIGATEVISTLSAGTFVEELIEYDEFSTVLATTNLLTVSGTGTVKPLSRFGSGSGAAAWQQATVTARLQHRFSGATVNGKVTLSEFRAIPTDALYRKYISAPKFIREPGQTDVPPATPHPRYATRVIGPPPSALRVAPAPSQVIDAFDFETGSLPSAWTLVNTNTTACQQAVVSSAAIGGSLGWQVKKTTSGTGYVYIYRTYTPSNRTTLAVRAKFRIRKLPTTTASTPLLQVKPSVSAAGARTPRLFGISIKNTGALDYNLSTPTLSTELSFSLGKAVVGDVIDVEVILSKSGNGGNANVAIGKNGATRVFQGWKGSVDWTGVNPTTPFLGLQYFYTSTATQAEYDVDDVVVTDSGDSLASASVTPPLVPLELPDRPTAPALVVESEYDFEAGTIPVAFTQTRTPADGTTTLTAQTASAINGTYGVRAADTGTATTANVYIQRQLASSRTSLGARARFRVVARPNSGEVQMLGLFSSSGQELGAITLDSTGALYARPYSAGVVQSGSAIASGIVNGDVLHLDLVAQYTGTTGGLLSAWVAVNGSGAANVRQLMYQRATLDWSAAQVNRARFGGFNESSAANTWSFDIDSILFTDVGETLFSENWNAGPINQAHIFLPPGTLVTDRWLLRGYREAVVPGLTYSAAIKARFRGVQTACRPCYFTAYDTQGQAYPLGALTDDKFPNGVSGTIAWDDYTRTFTIPTDCYEVRMDSKSVGEGEYVFQELAFSPGSSVTREVSYPTTGSVAFTLDTSGAVASVEYATLGRAWQDVGAIIDASPGTSGSASYRSRTAEGATVTDWTSDPTTLVQGRYADFDVALDGDGASTPRLKRGSPYIRYAIKNGAQQVATLLRHDRSEFTGGTIVTELGMPYMMTPHSVRVLPTGRVARQRMGDPVGFLPTCIIGVFTEEAAREIQEAALDDDFYIETRDMLMRVRFAQDIIFDPPLSGSLARSDVGQWMLWAEAETGDAEILELVDYTIS